MNMMYISITTVIIIIKGLTAEISFEKKFNKQNNTEYNYDIAKFVEQLNYSSNEDDNDKTIIISHSNYEVLNEIEYKKYTTLVI